MGENRFLVRPVTAFEPEDRAKPLLEGRHRPRVVVDAVGQGADLGRHIGQLGLEPGEPFGNGLEAGVQAS